VNPRTCLDVFEEEKHLTTQNSKFKIDPIPKTEWKEYYGKLWNEQGSKGEEGKKRRGEAKGQTATET